MLGDDLMLPFIHILVPQVDLKFPSQELGSRSVDLFQQTSPRKRYDKVTTRNKRLSRSGSRSVKPGFVGLRGSSKEPVETLWNTCQAFATAVSLDESPSEWAPIPSSSSVSLIRITFKSLMFPTEISSFIPVT